MEVINDIVHAFLVLLTHPSKGSEKIVFNCLYLPTIVSGIETLNK